MKTLCSSIASQGCGDEDANSFMLKGPGKEQSFRLARVNAKQCRPLQKWLERP
jgi:hypothetical protein